MGFTEALANVPLVISFATFPDETALQSDYVLPDHHWLESFGTMTGLPGATPASGFRHPAGGRADVRHPLHRRCAAGCCQPGRRWRR
jgi:anaerobic selenocysteine-containing dehydrogenase